ncbi:MAG: helix-turn-helix domain-containing protein [bacterium]
MEIFNNINDIEELFFRENKGRVYKVMLESLEKPLLERLLDMTSGNQLKASRILGINRNTLRSKIKKLGIRR